MATKASKYVYEIAAQYSGQSDLKRLQQDLDAIGKIDTYSKAADQWKKLNQEFTTAKQRAKELRQEMQQSGGDSSAKAYAKASQEVERLSKALQTQKSKLAESASELKAAGLAASKTSAQYQKLQSSVQMQGRASAARSTLGIRSDGSIQKEITGLQKAYSDLSKSGTASIAELARAKKSMNARIAELTVGTNRWNQSLLSSNNLLRGAALGIGIGMMARYSAQITGIADQYAQRLRRQCADQTGHQGQQCQRPQPVMGEIFQRPGSTTKHQRVNPQDGIDANLGHDREQRRH